MAIGPARMSLREHLGELRTRLVRVVLMIVVVTLLLYVASPTIGQFMLLPISEFIPKDADGQALLQALDPFEAFAVRLKISLWAAVVCTAPFNLWQILAFFLPALKPNERRWFIPTFASMVLLFILGTVFCYVIILNPAFGWLTGQASGLGAVIPRMNSYIGMIIKFELGFGIAFQLPIIVFYLVTFGIVPYKKIRGAWRYVYVILLTVSAIITPDGSPVTMLLLFAALLVLYEGSLLIARLALTARLRKQKAQEAEDAENIEVLKDLARSARDRATDFGDDDEESGDENNLDGGAANSPSQSEER